MLYGGVVWGDCYVVFCCFWLVCDVVLVFYLYVGVCGGVLGCGGYVGWL